MKIYFFYTLLIVSSTFLYPQNAAQLNYEGILTFKPNTKAFLFGDNVRLRKEPDTSSEELTLLRIGTEISILEITDTTKKINGLDSKWVKIKTQGFQGYLLDSFISIDTYKSLDSMILTNFKRNPDNTNYLRTRFFNIQSNKYEEIEYKLPHHSIEVSNIGNKGINNISNILYIDYVANACGMDGGGKYIFIKNNSVIDEIELYQVSEAGQFWQTEKLIFPNEDNKIAGNSFKFEQEIGNVIDESSQWYKKTTIERQHRIVNGEITPEFKSEEKH